MTDLVDSIAQDYGTNSTYNTLYDLNAAVYTWILHNYKVLVGNDDLPPDEKLYEVFSTYDLVYEYFFLAAGLTLVMLAVLLWLGKKEKTIGEYSSIALRCIVGLGLCLLVLMETSVDPVVDNNYYIFQESVWVLPTVMLSYLLGM